MSSTDTQGRRTALQRRPRALRTTAPGEQSSGSAPATYYIISSADLSRIESVILRDDASRPVRGVLVKKRPGRGKATGAPSELRVEIRPDPKLSPVVTDTQPALPSPVTQPDAPQDVDPELAAALTAARERGRLAVARIVAGPDMLNADAMADRLGVSRMTVNTWRDKGVLLGLAGPKRGFRFPDWQLDDAGRPYAELATLHDLLGDPWAVYRFLVQPHGELDGATGLQALQDGRGSAALVAAESIGRDFG
jgi:hypothetical protein